VRKSLGNKKPVKKKVSQGQKLRDLLESDEIAMKSGLQLPVRPESEFDTPWGPMSIRQEAFIRAYLNPDEAAGDLTLACRYGGCTKEVGSAWLNLPQIRARINHAMGERWITVEAILGELAAMGFGQDTFPPAKVRALELLAKARGMLVERSVSASVDLGDGNKLASLILKEIERIAPEAVRDDGEGATIDLPSESVKQLPADIPGALKANPPEPQIKKETYPECLRLKHKKTGEILVKHGAWRIAADGAICERCGFEETKKDPNVLREELMHAGYKYKDGVWLRGKFNGK
jgi:hypothetical protein